MDNELGDSRKDVDAGHEAGLALMCVAGSFVVAPSFSQQHSLSGSADSAEGGAGCKTLEAFGWG